MRRLGLVVLTCAGLLTGCGSIDQPATPSGSEGSFKDRAAAVAEAWQQSGLRAAWTSGFVPLQALTVEPDWTPNGDLKASYGNGWIRSASPLPDATGQGDIRFADGTSPNVQLVGARTAYSLLSPRSGDCPRAGQPPTCQWTTLTAARMSTMLIRTSRGLATAPAWRFTVAGLSQPLLRVAVAPSAITTLPEVPLAGDRPPEAVRGAVRLVSVIGEVVTFDIGIGSCDKDPGGLVQETPDVIVIGGSVTPPAPGMACNAQMLFHQVEARTKAPIGSRPIVDVLTAQPVLPQPGPTQP